MALVTHCLFLATSSRKIWVGSRRMPDANAGLYHRPPGVFNSYFICKFQRWNETLPSYVHTSSIFFPSRKNDFFCTISSSEWQYRSVCFGNRASLRVNEKDQKCEVCSEMQVARHWLDVSRWRSRKIRLRFGDTFICNKINHMRQ